MLKRDSFICLNISQEILNHGVHGVTRRNTTKLLRETPWSPWFQKQKAQSTEHRASSNPVIRCFLVNVIVKPVKEEQVGIGPPLY